MGDRIWQGRTNFGCQNWSGGTVFGGGPIFFVTGPPSAFPSTPTAPTHPLISDIRDITATVVVKKLSQKLAVNTAQQS